jgi:phage/plasmid-like protein (TIGR03299 family)
MNTERRPAWARAGHRIEGMSIEDAMRTARLDYTVGICDSVAEIPITNPDAPVQEYLSIPVKGRKRTYRTDTFVPFKEVGERYHPFQNHQAVGILESLVGGGWAPVYGGTLGGGAVMFMVGEIPMSLRTGEVAPYLAVVNSHDGSTGLRFANTPIRPACMNAITRTFAGASAVFSLRHTSRVSDRLEEAREALRLSTAYYRRLDDEIAQLLDTPLSGPLQETMLDVVFPLKGLDEKARSRRITKRANLIEHLHCSKTITPTIAKTAWGMIQAVTELEQWDDRRVAKPGHAERNLSYQLGVSPTSSASTGLYRMLDAVGIGTRP